MFISYKILLIKPCLLDPRSMVCKWRRRPKSPFNWWLKAYQVAIDFRVKIISAQSIKSQIQKIKASEDRLGDALPEARRAPSWQGHGNAALAAFSRPFGRARLRFGPRVTHVAPFPLVPINTPKGSSVEADPENRVVICVLLLGIVVTLVCFF